MSKVCIVGASGKLGRYMVQHALDRGLQVHAVCRAKSVSKLDGFKGRITIFPGCTNDRGVIEEAVCGCDGVLTVLVPWGVQQYASGTAQAVLDFALFMVAALDMAELLQQTPAIVGCTTPSALAFTSAR